MSPLEKIALIIEAIPPYDFTLTAGYATYFRGRYGSDRFENGLFRRLLDVNGKLCLASVSPEGTTDAPRLNLTLTAQEPSRETIVAAKQQLSRILGTEQDLTLFYKRASSDKYLARLVRAFYGLHIPQTASVFEGLILAILGQQISSQVAFKLRTALIQACGASIEIDATTYHAFPQPTSIVTAGPAKLRTIGLSARKAEYILDIAHKVADSELNLEALRKRSDEEIVATLTDIRGVGSWTAQWLLIRAFERSDGFPASDLALLRMMGVLMGRDSPLSPGEAIEYSRRWSPFRSCVTSYLFAAARSGQSDLFTPAASIADKPK